MKNIKYPTLLVYFGAAGAGKDYLARQRANKLIAEGKTVQFIPFAENVKIACAAIEKNGLSFFEDPITKNEGIGESNFTRRQLMEQIADLGYKISNTHWFDLWEKDFLASSADYVIVTDYRYLQSLPYIRKYGGELTFIRSRIAELTLSPQKLGILYSLASHSKDFKELRNDWQQPFSLSPHLPTSDRPS